jgi:hypothetical protein
MSTVTDTVEKYLTEKYNDSFTFDSYGNNSWSSVKTTLIYRDKHIEINKIISSVLNLIIIQL